MIATVESGPPLLVVDRCDACTAQALVRVVRGLGELLDFCQHHYNENASKLADAGFVVGQDVRKEAR